MKNKTDRNFPADIKLIMYEAKNQKGNKSAHRKKQGTFVITSITDSFQTFQFHPKIFGL